MTALSRTLMNTWRSRAGSAITGIGSSGSSYARCRPSSSTRRSTMMAASLTSATRSKSCRSSFRPFCIREKSSSSTTMLYRRSASLEMTCTPRRKFGSAGSRMAAMVSTQPLMEVSGVRSSWETEEMNSFFMRSVLSSSPAIWLMVSDSLPISSLYLFSIRVSRFPSAIFAAVASISPMGRTMLRMKNMPVHTLNSTTAVTSARLKATSAAMLWSTSVRLVTKRTATISPAARGSSVVTAITFSPMAVRYTAWPSPFSLASASR